MDRFFQFRAGACRKGIAATDQRRRAVSALDGCSVSTEVLQRLTRDVRRIEQYMSQWDLLEPSGLRTYREAAAIFRLARAKGVSLTTIDVLIAAIALEHRASVFTLDKDFSPIARLTGLPLYPPPAHQPSEWRRVALVAEIENRLRVFKCCGSPVLTQPHRSGA